MSTLSHSQARSILNEAWRSVHGRAPSERELGYAQAIAWLENQYGRAGQFGAFADAGAFNWGSLHAKGRPPNCPANAREGYDQGPVCFLAFGSDDSAARAFLRTLTV